MTGGCLRIFFTPKERERVCVGGCIVVCVGVSECVMGNIDTPA